MERAITDRIRLVWRADPLSRFHVPVPRSRQFPVAQPGAAGGRLAGTLFLAEQTAGGRVFRSSYVPASRRRVPLRRPRTSRCPCAASRATSVSSPRTAAAAPLSTSTGVRWHAADQRSLSTWVATRRGRSCATSPPPECREECPSSSRATSVGPRRSGYRPASTCLTLQRAPLRLTPRH